MCAREHFDGSSDLVVCYGDLCYESRHITALAASDAAIAITVDRQWRRLWSLRMDDPLRDAETLRLDAAGNVTELGRKPRDYADIEGQYMGLIRIGAGFARQFVQTYDSLDPDGTYDGRDRDGMYMTAFLQLLVDRVTPVAAVMVDGGWLEVDTTDDLDTYEALRAAGELDRYCVLGGS